MSIKSSQHFFFIPIIILLLTACFKNSSNHPYPSPNSSQLDNVQQVSDVTSTAPKFNDTKADIIVAAQRTDAYVPLMQGKKIAMVVNHTSFIDNRHIVDSLLTRGINIQKIFAPEHGFRGQADAGATVKDGKDAQTGLPIVSLYGKNKKPSSLQLKGIELVVFDIQDVGARFYTYISTMHYVMEACAENNIPFMVLDRPNPNGHYIDGPILEDQFRSFVGIHPIPVVHGLTVAELARMINGEKWLNNGVQCNLIFISCQNYAHDMDYKLPIKPSPNLPNMRSILLYPSLCFFEGTTANVGRGTTQQFQIIGHPSYPKKDFVYTPVSRPGAQYPKFKNKTCYGVDLSTLAISDIKNEQALNLSYLVDYYTQMPNKNNFFLSNKFIDKLAGTDQLRKSILAGQTAQTIKNSWQNGLEEYKILRKAYLLYE